MKRVAITLTVVVLSCCVSYGQEVTGPNSEHLKCFDPMIGTWQYEGPLLEDVPEIAKKGSDLVFQFSWRRILNKSVVEENWAIEFEGGATLAGKALIGWNAAEKHLSYGGMDSYGGMSLGVVVFDADAKSSTLTEKGIDGDGKETSFKGVVIKTGKDTLTWQALERVGGIVEGPSPVYTYTRVKPEGSKQAK
jgi:hypothetical protein